MTGEGPATVHPPSATSIMLHRHPPLRALDLLARAHVIPRRLRAIASVSQEMR